MPWYITLGLFGFFIFGLGLGFKISHRRRMSPFAELEQDLNHHLFFLLREGLIDETELTNADTVCEKFYLYLKGESLIELREIQSLNEERADLLKRVAKLESEEKTLQSRFRNLQDLYNTELLLRSFLMKIIHLLGEQNESLSAQLAQAEEDRAREKLGLIKALRVEKEALQQQREDSSQILNTMSDLLEHFLSIRLESGELFREGSYSLGALYQEIRRVFDSSFHRETDSKVVCTVCGKGNKCKSTPESRWKESHHYEDCKVARIHDYALFLKTQLMETETN